MTAESKYSPVSGSLPSYWITKPLKRAAVFIEGPGVLANDFSDAGIPLLRISGIGGRVATLEGANFVSPEISQKWEHLRVRLGDLLISGSASTGLCSEVGETTVGAIPYTGIIIVRPIAGQATKDFLRWFFLSDQFSVQVEHYKAGSAIQHFGPTHLSQMSITLPPEDEQRTIARFLDRETAELDALIATKERVLELLIEKQKAVTTVAVTHGVTRDIALRNSGIPWLGEIPAHWQVEKAKWLFEERDERSVSGTEEMLTVSHLTGVTPRSEKEVNMFEPETTEGYKLCFAGDLVINTLWAWMGAMGVARVGGIVSPAYNVYRPGDRVDPEFIDALVRIRIFAQEVTRYSKGVWSSRLRLYPEGFFEVHLPVPPLQEQRMIVAHIRSELSKIGSALMATQHSISLLKERRAALISEALSGQVEVT